ncbi:5'-nucleotidase-like [Contarinia nasturtii]|uniref:5'-nucleotidase-like n=1 Tax=Contarinia nasturtii TaxID=265458 RepID=UPI0012D4B7BE|nr:5'-nucleotidase-like [Contarinia nasturtii]
MKITGEKLMKAFEHSVVEYVEHEFIASFLQMSGFRVVFDVALKPGSRVLSVEIRNSQNLYEKLNLQKVYNVVTSEWLMKNGDGFTMFKDCEAKYLQIPILDALTNHIKKSKVLNPSPVHEGRITVHNVFPLKKGVPPLHDNN